MKRVTLRILLVALLGGTALEYLPILLCSTGSIAAGTPTVPTQRHRGR